MSTSIEAPRSRAVPALTNVPALQAAKKDQLQGGEGEPVDEDYMSKGITLQSQLQGAIKEERCALRPAAHPQSLARHNHMASCAQCHPRSQWICMAGGGFTLPDGLAMSRLGMACGPCQPLLSCRQVHSRTAWHSPRLYLDSLRCGYILRHAALRRHGTCSVRVRRGSRAQGPTQVPAGHLKTHCDPMAAFE